MPTEKGDNRNFSQKMGTASWVRLSGSCPLLLAALLAVVSVTPAAAQLTQLVTPSVRIIYFNGTEGYLVPYAARTFLNSLQFQERLWRFDPSQKITVLLVDFSDAGNAAATVVPRDLVTVEISPLNFAFETLAANERLNTIMNHELVHIATMDQGAGSDLLFRRLFGGKVNPVAEQPESILYFFLTTPRVATPRWYEEGIAVFVDTWMAGGLGRVQSGYDEMVFRTKVRDGTPLYDPLGLVSAGTKIDFQLQINSYLYGARFMAWLARTYSPEKVVEWVSRNPGSRAYYSSQFKQVFGRSLEDAWHQWTEDEKTFQLQNLEAIRKYPLTPYRDLTPKALGSVSRSYFDPETHTLYSALDYPGVVAHIGAINVDTGAIAKLVNVKGPEIYTVAALAFDPSSHTLFYTTDNTAHRDLVALDTRTHRTHLLQKDARIGDLAFDRADKSLWGIRHLNGICSLVRMAPPYREWTRIVSWPYGTVMYDLDVSPDGGLVSASMGEIDGKQDVRVFTAESLMKGSTEAKARFDMGQSVPSGFVFSPDGRYLYGSSYYTGVSNIFRYEIATGTVSAMTNTDGGFFRPVPLDDGRLLAFRYTGNGFVPAEVSIKPLDDVSAITFFGERLAEEHPVVKDWNVGSPAKIDLESIPQSTEPYKIAHALHRESFYPIVQGYKDTAAVGLRVNLSDPVQLNRASISVAISPGPSDERVHLTSAYERYDWRGRFELNRADFYDLFGPTKTSRKGYVIGLGHHSTLLFDEPRRLELELDGSYSGNLDRLPESQNVVVDVRRLGSAEARLHFTNVRNSLGYVDDETGTKWSAVAHADAVQGEVVTRWLGTLDHGWALAAGHSSLWLRGAAGFSPQRRDDPFANFYFGGFGNNWVDARDEKRYREYYSFPGFSIDEVPGRNFVKTIAEWNLPPLRFTHAGTPGFYATWVRPAVFVGGLITNFDDSSVQRRALDAGGQLDVRFSVLSALDMTVSAGAAVAFPANGPRRGEAMLSLKILR
jgi:hypothetical protein